MSQRPGAVNYYQKELHLRPRKSPRSGSGSNKNGTLTEWVIRKTSPKTKPSKTSKYNVSIAEHLHQSKNESSVSQNHT